MESHFGFLLTHFNLYFNEFIYTYLLDFLLSEIHTMEIKPRFDEKILVLSDSSSSIASPRDISYNTSITREAEIIGGVSSGI